MKRGLKICQLAIKNNILKKSVGVIVFDDRSYKLHTIAFINYLGFFTYESKKLALAEKEFSVGEIDRFFHITNPEKKFFYVTFKVE